MRMPYSRGIYGTTRRKGLEGLHLIALSPHRPISPFF
jgi:hypothetical protein